MALDTGEGGWGMAMDATEVARLIKEELEKLGEIQSIGYVTDLNDAGQITVLGAETLDGHGVFITVENY
jgi:hypothetical protein